MKYFPFILISIFISSQCFAQNLPPVWSGVDNLSCQSSSLTKTYISPHRVLWKEGIVLNEAVLLQNGNGQTDLSGQNLATLRADSLNSAAILLDYGKELQGGIQVVGGFLPGNKPVKIRVRFGESVSEAMGNIGVHGATNDHAMRDFIMEIPSMGVAEIGNSGFRFVRIDLVDKNSELNFKELRAVFYYRDLPYLGKFRCDNERLNEIWMTGAYTVHLNMQEYLWDGVKRDRLVWIGDLHPEVMTVNAVFGHNEVVNKSLDLVRDITPPTAWMNGISSYSIWWLLIQRDWYFNHGDKNYLLEQREYMTALVNNMISKVGADGKENLDGWRFMDWPSSNNQKGVDAGLQALLVMAMDAAEELFKEMGDNNMSVLCGEKAKLLRTVSPDVNNSKQAAALMSLSGLMSAEKANRDVISVGGSANFSTFYGYYMLKAMAKDGDYVGAMDRISEYWGAMLDLGATTFWEDFDMNWLNNAARIDELVPEGKTDVHASYGDYCYVGHRHSFCHGWASGPTAWLSEFVLGVKVIEPGCKVVQIRPNLGNLNWVEGSFPTPYGVISIKHNKNSDGTVKSVIDAPRGVKIIR